MGWLFGETVKKDANYHGCRYVWTKLHQKENDLVKLKKVFDAADRSGDGEVDIHEFLMYLDVERTKLIEHIFRQFDTDGGDSASSLNLNLTWSRRWRLHETASPRRRRRSRQRA